MGGFKSRTTGDGTREAAPETTGAAKTGCGNTATGATTTGMKTTGLIMENGERTRCTETGDRTTDLTVIGDATATGERIINEWTIGDMTATGERMTTVMGVPTIALVASLSRTMGVIIATGDTVTTGTTGASYSGATAPPSIGGRATQRRWLPHPSVDLLGRLMSGRCRHSAFRK